MALSHQPLARPPRRSAGPLQPPRPGAARSGGPRRGAGCVGLHGPPLDMGTVMPRVAGCKRWVSPCQRGVTGQRLQWPASVPCGWTIEVGSVWWFQPSLQPPPTPHTQQGWRDGWAAAAQNWDSAALSRLRWGTEGSRGRSVVSHLPFAVTPCAASGMHVSFSGKSMGVSPHPRVLLEPEQSSSPKQGSTESPAGCGDTDVDPFAWKQKQGSVSHRRPHRV